jgi:PIN domain nuclease of toxin-antitoxin system
MQKSHYSEPEIFVTDTHALLWYLTEDKRLGKKALKIFKKNS